MSEEQPQRPAAPHPPEGSDVPHPTGEAPTAHQAAGNVPASHPEVGSVSAAQPEVGAVPGSQPVVGSVPASHPEVGSVSAAQQEVGGVPGSQPVVGSVSAAQPEVGAAPGSRRASGEGPVPGSGEGEEAVSPWAVGDASSPPPVMGTVPHSRQVGQASVAGSAADAGATSSQQASGASDPRPAVGDASDPRPAAGRRAPLWLVAVLVVVAAGVGLGAGALIWAGRTEKVYPPGYHALTPEQYDKCVRNMIVSFNGQDPDPDMRQAAAKLRHDDRFESVREETRREAYEQFKKTFADQPELIELARPEALPASVKLMVRKGTTAKQVEGTLRGEFPDAEITVQDYCPGPAE